MLLTCKCDLFGILAMTPISDRYHKHRGILFLFPCVIIIVGLIVAIYAPNPWPRYVGLLIVGFGPRTNGASVYDLVS